MAGQREVRLDEQPPDPVGLGARRLGQGRRDARGEHARRPDHGGRGRADRARPPIVTPSASMSVTSVVEQRRHAEADAASGSPAWTASAGTRRARDRPPRPAGRASVVVSMTRKSLARVAGDLGDLARPSRPRSGPAPTTTNVSRRSRSASLSADLGGLERPQDLRADVQRALERLQLGRVLLPLRVAEVVVLRAAADDQRVVVERLLAGRGPQRELAARRGRSRSPRPASRRTLSSPRKIARSG